MHLNTGKRPTKKREDQNFFPKRSRIKSSMNKAFSIAVLLVYLFTMFSCKSTKEFAGKRRALKKKDDIIQAIQENSLEYDALVLKGGISVVSKKRKVSFRTQIRIKKDSAIWSSVTFLGIAGAKVLVTNDTMKMVNYKDRNFINEDNSKLIELFKTKLLSLKNLQALMTGDQFDLGPVQKYHVKLIDGQYVISTLSERKSSKQWGEKKYQKMEKKLDKKEDKNKPKGQDKIDKKIERRPDKFGGVEATIWADTATVKVVELRVKDYMFDGGLTAVYSNFKETEAGVFPMNCNITIDSEERIEFNIVYSKVSVEEKVKMPFSIPKKYEKVKM